MRFRFLDIPKLVFQTLRTNYSVRNDYNNPNAPHKTTYIYRFCLSVCDVFKEYLENYYIVRWKGKLLAACTPTYGQIERVLTEIYDYQILITPSNSSLSNSFWYGNPTPKIYLYTSNTPPRYLGTTANYSAAPIINIPSDLANDSDLYAEFIADLNTLVPFYINYNINIY